MCVDILPGNVTDADRYDKQTVAYFGAFVFGSDIDGRQMRGKATRMFYLFPTYLLLLIGSLL